MNKEEIEKAFVEAKKELEMPREELLNKLWDTQQENQELKLELSGYRQAILKYKEMLGLKEQNQKYKEVIDEAIEWVKDWTHGANDWFEEDSKPSELLDILKEVE